MKSGILYWNDSRIRYDQVKNAVEAIIRKVLNEHNITRGWLESCGASAFCTLMEGLGYIGGFNYPKVNGISIQFDDYVMMVLNDPRNDHLFSKGLSFDNRAMINYVNLALLLFGIKASYKNLSWNAAIKELKSGNGVQICLKDPGHYIAAIAYDEEKEVILISDSWGSRAGNVNNGWQEELSKAEYETNTHTRKLIYPKRVA